MRPGRRFHRSGEEFAPHDLNALSFGHVSLKATVKSRTARCLSWAWAGYREKRKTRPRSEPKFANQLALGRHWGFSALMQVSIDLSVPRRRRCVICIQKPTSRSAASQRNVATPSCSP